MQGLPMLRNVLGQRFEGKPSLDRWVVTLHDLGNGHREGCIQRAIDWEHVGPETVYDLSGDPLVPRWTDEDQSEKDVANAKRAARRAKTAVRRRCKAQGLDTLVTGTYKGLQVDLDLCKLHFQTFMKRLERAIGKVCYVVAFERQKRGAWHWHMATHRLPQAIARKGVKVKSWNVIRAMWRGVTGEHAGNIDVNRRKSHSKKSPAKVASYISKYVLKAFEEGEDHSKRWHGSRCELPAAVRMEFSGASLSELVELVVVEVADARQVATTWLSSWGDVFFVAGEAIPPERGS
jgi:hypothetical protein